MLTACILASISSLFYLLGTLILLGVRQVPRTGVVDSFSLSEACIRVFLYPLKLILHIIFCGKYRSLLRLG